jgi:hypothetical protein
VTIVRFSNLFPASIAKRLQVNPDSSIPAILGDGCEICTVDRMKTVEDAVNDAVINPLSRLIILLFGTWLIGSLYPIPEAIFNLIRGIYKDGDFTVIDEVRWFDFDFEPIPVLGALFSETALVSGPIAVFCVVCSALDRWTWWKVTLLSGLSTFSMRILQTWPDYGVGWLSLTLAQLLIVGLILLVFRPLREF